jgi:hypothetical protein
VRREQHVLERKVLPGVDRALEPAGRGYHRATGSDEQRITEELPQAAERVAHGALRYIELLGCGRDAPGAQERFESLKKSQVELAHLVPHARIMRAEQRVVTPPAAFGCEKSSRLSLMRWYGAA